MFPRFVTKSMHAFLDYPVAGTGIGAFRDAFPHYMQAGEFARWSQLHNDYLEFLKITQSDIGVSKHSIKQLINIIEKGGNYVDQSR